MATGLYDDQKEDTSSSPDVGQGHYDREFADIAKHYDETAPDRDDLRGAEEAGDATGAGSSGGETPGSVLSGEKQGDTGAPNPQPRGFFGRTRAYFSGPKNKLKRRIAIITGGIITILTPLLVLLAFLLLALRVPHFVANVTAWQFAKVTRIQATSVDNIMNEELAMKAADDGWFKGLQQRYQGMRDKTFENLEKYSSRIVIRNLNKKNLLNYNETARSGTLGKLGFSRINAITINDRSVLVPKTMYDWKFKYVHPIQSIKQRNQFFLGVQDAVDTYNPNLNRFIRTNAALKVIGDRFGTDGFRGIRMKNFFGKSKVNAAAELQAETYEVAAAKASTPNSAPDEVKKATQDAADETDKCVKDNECLKKTTGSTDGLTQGAQDSTARAFTSSAVGSFLKGAIGVINPLYAVAVPVCLVYSGSVYNPDESNAQSDALQREATQLFAVDAQIKKGDTNSISVNNGQVSTNTPTSDDQIYNVNGDGVGAVGQKLDGPDGSGIINSNAMLRAGGQHPNTLQVGSGTQQTALGGFGSTTIFDVLLPHSISGHMNDAADELCPAATNIWAGAALGVANLVVLAVSAMGSAGTAAAAEYGSEAGAEVAARSAMEIFVNKIVATFTTKAGAVQAFSSTGKFGYQFTKTVARDTALIVGATYLAQLMTFYNSGLFHNGLQSGAPYANDIDNGANQLGNTMCQGTYYGRFLTYAETAQNEQDDRVVQDSYTLKQNTYQRYFALSNPDSMLTKFGEATVTKVNRRTVSTAVSNLGNVFNPMSFMPKLFGSLTGKAAAAANVATENYGNLQCGYTRDEYALIHGGGDASYASPNENAYQLDNAGKDTFDAIDKEYGPCFTEKIGTLMTKEDGDGHKYLIRHEDGDLSADSVCSPQNLGTNNPKYGDLVFRYRLEHMYDASIKGLYQIQKAGQAELGTAKT